jgi:hypothetical protein
MNVWGLNCFEAHFSYLSSSERSDTWFKLSEYKGFVITKFYCGAFLETHKLGYKYIYIQLWSYLDHISHLVDWLWSCELHPKISPAVSQT